jgi:hypothetical protein
MNSQQAEACSVGEDDAFDLAARNRISRQRGLQPTPVCNDLHSTLCRLIVATTQIDVLAPRYGCGRDDVRIRLMCSGGSRGRYQQNEQEDKPVDDSLHDERILDPTSFIDASYQLLNRVHQTQPLKEERHALWVSESIRRI